ncbi:MAG: hypothetical protein H6680_04820 [Desulfobacteraceae bacterium]|nr:hypothetical protein [Desulfobacteraceae bacterium]
MNEFLQHLRATSNDRRRNNKNYKNNDGNIGNHHPERRSGNDRRLRAPKPSGIKEEAITALRQSIDEIQNAVQDHILVLERNTDAQERQAEALEHIADMFAVFLERLDDAPAVHQEAIPREAEILDESNLMMSAEEADQVKKTSRTYILNLIQSLRDKNSTYDEIALYLTENDFPTFSGRGRWHAQTIHRLCQEIKKAKAKKMRH